MATMSGMVERDGWSSSNASETLEDIEREREELKRQRVVFRAKQTLWKEREEFRAEVIEATRDDTLEDGLEEMIESMICRGLSVWKSKNTNARTNTRYR